MAARMKKLKDELRYTHSLPVLNDTHQTIERVVVMREPMTSSSTALNWSGSMAVLPALKGSRAQSLHVLGVTEDGIVAPVGAVTWPLAMTAIAAIMGSSFPHGWNTGVLNAPSHLINSFLNESFTSRFGYSPSEQLLSILWATTVSIYLVGGCAGAFSAGWLANKFGRKLALIALHSFGFISAVLFGICEYANSFEMIIMARLVVGYACGAGSGIVPMYLTEIAPVNVRGAMGVLHQFALTCGILISQVVGMRQLLGNESCWPILLAVTAVPCVVSMVILPFFPDSPRFLYVTKGDKEAARRALQKFRGLEDVDLDIKEMEQEVQHQQNDPEWNLRQLFAARSLRKSLVIICALAMAQQLSGINIVFYYSTTIFEASGIPRDYIQYAVLATGIINVIMTAISIPLMEKSGRRPLLLGGMVLMIVSACVIMTSLNLQARVPIMAYFSCACIITFVIGFAIGLGSIPQFIGGELFLQGPRPPAMSVAGFLNWFCNFLVGITFPSLELALQEFSFTIFIAIIVIFFIFLWKTLPETKNKTHQEIYNILRGKKAAPVVDKENHRELLPVDTRLVHSTGNLQNRTLRSQSSPPASPSLAMNSRTTEEKALFHNGV